MSANRKLATTVSALALFALDGPTMAQSAPVDEIVVTARKREESLLEVPVSVSALSQGQLDNADIDNPIDLSDFVPGLDFDAANAGTDGRGSNPNITFRGIRQQLGTPSTQVGAIFWDGSYMGGGGAIVPLDDLQRVEVIKGPQTAYFGRNTFSGAINYIPRTAGEEFAGDAELSYSPSDFDSYKVSVAAGAPFSERAGARASVTYKKEGGDFAFGDGEPLNENKSLAFSGVLNVEPIESLRLRFSGYFVDTKDTYVNVSIAATVPAGQCNRTFTGQYINVATGVRTPFTRDFSRLTFAEFCGRFPRGDNIVTPRARVPTAANSIGGDVSAAFNENVRMAKYGGLPDLRDGFGGANQAKRFQINGDYDIPGDHVLSVIASRAVTGSSLAFDQNFGLATSPLLLPRGFQTWIREAYYEARVTSPQDQDLRYMLGLTDYSQKYRNATTGNLPNINFENNASFSIFAAADYDFTDQLTLSLEARWTDDKAFVILNGNPNLPLPNTTVTANSANSFNKFIPRVILTYKPTDATTIYGSFSESALIGLQTNARVVSGLDPVLIPNPNIFGDFTPPQKNTAYELGWKQQWESASLTVAAFHMKWINQIFQTTVLAGVQTTQLALPGSSKYKGIEAEANANVTEWLDLQAGVTYVDGKLTSYAARSTFESVVLGSGSLAVVSDGYRPRGAVEWTGNLSATVHGDLMDRAWYIRGDALYEGGRYADNEEFNLDPGATRYNLRGGIDLVDGVRGELYANNITNLKRLPAIAFTTTGVGANRKIFTGPPTLREVGVRFLADF
ncbi:MAG: TonB-dependent receptor [Rhodospirillaceae bacterium]|nr:TonB-dependent receptor [Rhodospirillaceae bacterium]